MSRRQLEKREKQFNYNDVRIQRVRTHATKVTERRLYTKEEGSPKNTVGGGGTGVQEEEGGKKKSKRKPRTEECTHSISIYGLSIIYWLVIIYFPADL